MLLGQLDPDKDGVMLGSTGLRPGLRPGLRRHGHPQLPDISTLASLWGSEKGLGRNN